MNEYMDFFIEDGILMGIPKKKFHITMDVVIQLYESRLEVCNGKEYPTLIFIDSVEYVNKELRDFHENVSSVVGATAWAFVTPEKISQILINLYLSAMKIPVPTKYFSNKEEALKWLEKFK